MTIDHNVLPRRNALKAAGALTLAGFAPALTRAQGAPLQLGVLTPLTGAGGFDGPRMLKAMKSVMDEVNAAGGLLGRKVELVVEDDQTNPEAAVRAARKLIDVTKVPAIMGTWASAVTTAVAPVCWESKTFLTTVSGADSITKLPHLGYLIRTQPNNYLQAAKHAEFIASLGVKRCFMLSIQAPFSVPTQDRATEVLKQKGSEMVGTLIYDKDKTTYRSEIDQALKTNPDMIYLNGYSPDVTILLRDLYRAGYTGMRFSQSYAVTSKVLESLPAEVTEGVITVQPSADVNSPAYDLAKKRLGISEPDSYETQATDWASLVALAIAKAKAATGVAIHDNVRKISQGGGSKVYSAVDGLKLLAEGKEINYEGASGPCDFTDIGDIVDCKFRYNKAVAGKFVFLKVVSLAPVFAEVAQLVVNGVMAGTILAIPAIGLTAIYAVLRFPNFALASHATVGAFAGYLANVKLGWPILPSVVVAFLAAGVVGVLSDEIVLKRMRPAGFITTAIASIALTIALENIVRFAFGNELRGYALPIERDWRFGGIRVGPQQVQNLAIATVAMGALFCFLAFTRTGKAMRAVADNPMLASIKGIDAEMVSRLVNFTGMGLAGLGGMLIGLDTTIDPLTGFRSILSVFAAAVVGGLGSIPGAVVGAMTVGIGEELCLLFLSPDYRSVVGFVAILLVLTLRPRGILGQRAY